MKFMTQSQVRDQLRAMAKPSNELRRWKRWDTARPYQELSIAACGMILGCEWEGSWFQLGTERRAEIMSEAIEAAEALGL